MATYTIIVDDRDPGIIYSPQTVGSSGSQLDGWLHTTGVHFEITAVCSTDGTTLRSHQRRVILI